MPSIVSKFINGTTKWLRTMIVTGTDRLAYKFDFVLYVIGPAVVFFFIKYNLWNAIFAFEDGKMIRGYNLQTMLEYQGWVMVVSLLAQGHRSLHLSDDIRLGRVSSFLLYPFGFWQFHTASFLALQCIQLVVTSATIFILAMINIITPDPVSVLVGIAFSFAVGFLWYAFQFLIGVCAFWLDETWILRVMLSTMAQFLSGAIFPLELYPEWLSKILMYTPFPYLAYFPVRIFSGNFEGSLFTSALILTGWIVIIFVIANFAWKKGLRLYTAAGM